MIRKFESCKLFLDLINSMVILMYKIYVWCIYDNFLLVSFFFFYKRLLIYFYMILFILFIFWKSYEILLINNEIVFIRNKK